MKHVGLVRSRQASAIDYPRDNLDPLIWDLTEDPPTLQPKVRELILDVVGQLEEEMVLDDYLEYVFIAGSSTGLNWLPETDIDVHLYLGENTPDDYLDQVWATLDELGDLYVGEHPIQFFAGVDEGFDERMYKYENLYDVLADDWIKFDRELASLDPAAEEERVYTQAVSWAHKIDLDLAETQRDYADFNFLLMSLRRASASARKGIKKRIEQKVQEIEEDVTSLVATLGALQRERHNAFEEALENCPGEECVVGEAIKSLNYLPQNVVYKLLERWRYVKLLKSIKEWQEESVPLFDGRKAAFRSCCE